MSNEGKLFISYPDLEHYASAAINQMDRVDFLPTTIVALGGGGLIPAAMVQYGLYKKFDLRTRLISLYCMAYKDRVNTGTVHIDYTKAGGHFTPSNLGKVLAVDDICDSGDTLEAIRKHLPVEEGNLRCAVLVDKPAGLAPGNKGPDFYGYRMGPLNRMWVEFPWERRWKGP